MAKENYRTCCICGKDYKFCNTCPDYADLPRWYMSFCGENCKDIFATNVDWTRGIITTEEAREKYKKLKIDYNKIVRPNLVENIKAIMSFDEDPVVEVADVISTDTVEITNGTISDTVVINDKPQFYGKKKKKNVK